MRTLRLAALPLAVALSLAPRTGHAQDADRAAILATVQKVFDAMRTRDTALLLQAFDTSARLVGVSNRGTPGVRLTTPSQFGAAITRAPAGDVWNERIFDPEVRIDGEVAQVWAYFTFHRNATFTHCGVDAFMLVKVAGTWKITQLADSNRQQGCTHTEPLKP
jgi:putative lumazine-binding protein